MKMAKTGGEAKNNKYKSEMEEEKQQRRAKLRRVVEVCHSWCL
jgi:hypothetical protein